MESTTILADYIKNKFMYDRNAKLNNDADLLDTGILDSLSILQLVVFIEEKFGIQMPDEDVIYDNFKSINALATYIQQYNK